MADRTGQIIGQRFRIDALIGRGAMADVFRALDMQTAAYVALKILRTSLDGDPAAPQRFLREAEVQARLRHPNIAALLATGVTDHGEPYLALELLRGKTLRGVLKQAGRVDARLAASYTWQALQGLAAVHAMGVLHRDLKPANIMLEPSQGPADRVVLIDFGFASVEGSAKLTQQGAIVGSLTYMAPERMRGEPIDQRSDLYSMGVIFYELLAGVPSTWPCTVKGPVESSGGGATTSVVSSEFAGCEPGGAAGAKAAGASADGDSRCAGSPSRLARPQSSTSVSP